MTDLPITYARETGRVASLTEAGCWVDVRQRSTCGGCAAKEGCGQRLLHRWAGKYQTVWVSDEGLRPSVGDEVEIGIPEGVVSGGAVLVYLLPLFTMIVAALLANSVVAVGAESADVTVAVSAVTGFVAGSLLVRWHAKRRRNDPRFTPMLLTISAV